MSLFLDEARVRASLGYIPILQQLGFTSNGKKIVKHSMSYRDMAYPDLNRLEAYLKRNKETNALGVLMQTNLVNLDFDSMPDYEWFVNAKLIEPAEVATTSITHTASGKYHYIYKLPDTWADRYLKTIRIGGRDVDVLFGINNVEYVYPTTLPDGRSYKKLGVLTPAQMPEKLRVYLEQFLTTKAGSKRPCKAPVVAQSGDIATFGTKSRTSSEIWRRSIYPAPVTAVHAAKNLQNAIPYRYVRIDGRLVREWTKLAHCKSILRLYSVAIVDWDGKSDILWPHVACRPVKQRDVLLLNVDDEITGWIFADCISGIKCPSSYTGIDMRKYSLVRDISQLWDLDKCLRLYPGLWTTCPRVIEFPNALLNHVIDAAAYCAVGREVTLLETAVMKHKLIFPDPIQLLQQTQVTSHKWTCVTITPGIDVRGTVETIFYTSDGAALHPVIARLQSHRLVFSLKTTLLIPHAAFVNPDLGIYLSKQPCTAAELCLFSYLNSVKSRLKDAQSPIVRARFDTIKASEVSNLHIPTYFNAPPCVKHVLAHGELKHNKRWPLARLLVQTANAAHINPDLLNQMMLTMIRQCPSNSFRDKKWMIEYKSELNAALTHPIFKCSLYRNARGSRFGCPFVADFPGECASMCLSSRVPHTKLPDIEDITPVDIWLKTSPAVPGPA